MTASRLVALTLGELRRTSETSDLDTPARAATVSRVGFRAVRPGGAMRPSFCQRFGALQPYERGEIVSTSWTPGNRDSSAFERRGSGGFMAFADGQGRGRAGWRGRAGRPARAGGQTVRPGGAGGEAAGRVAGGGRRGGGGP